MRRRAGLLLGLAYAAFVSLGLPDGLTGVAWPSIRAGFGLSLDALGALTFTGTIGYLLSSFTSGKMLSTIGVGWLLVLSCLATAVSLLGYAAAPAWLVMVGLGLLAGLGAGAIDAGLNTYAAENFTPRTMNWLHASFGLGAAIGPLLMSSVIAGGQSYRLGYLIVGVAQVILASLFALTRKQWHAHAEEGRPEQVPSAAMRRTLALPAAWLSILLFFLYSGLEFSAGIWLYTLLTEARGVQPAEAGVWVSVYWGALTVGRLVSGAIVARITVRALLQLSMLGAIVGVLLLWLNFAPWLSWIGVALLGMSLAPMFPSFVSLTPARMGPAHSANTIGFQIAAAMLGGAALVALFGLIADRFGLELLGPFLLVVAVLMALAFEVLERRPRSPRAES
ncbi:MAG TPA: MFS transporter [Chloroflexia bacterium]|nr:MFS transporter [Chloroflexia bacterium]